MNIYPDEEISPTDAGTGGGEDGGTTDVPEQMPEGADEAMRQNDLDNAIEAPVTNPDEPVDIPASNPDEPVGTPTVSPDEPDDTPAEDPDTN